MKVDQEEPAIEEKGEEEEWVKDLPEPQQESEKVAVQQTKVLDPEESLEALRSYKELAKARLEEIEEKLEKL